VHITLALLFFAGILVPNPQDDKPSATALRYFSSTSIFIPYCTHAGLCLCGKRAERWRWRQRTGFGLGCCMVAENLWFAAT